MILTLEQGLDQVAEYSQLDVHRVPTGFPTIDRLVKGPAPGELFTIVGRSFTGKSIVGTNIIYRNPLVPSILFSLEMDIVQSLIRLYAMWSGMNQEILQDMVDAGGLPDELYGLAEAFPRHVIVDTPGLSVDGMADKYAAYRSMFNIQPSFCVIDYLELVGKAKISGEGYQATESQITQIKDWARTEKTRVFLIHQANKSEHVYEPPTEDSPRGGGFTESDFMVGIWKPAKNPDLGAGERRWLEDKLGMNIIKNRPYFKLLDELLLRFDPSLRLTEVM